jgi:hypothetical protein
MAIVRMISRDLAEFRAFQSRMPTVGKIRLGVHNGRYPEKIDTFRFTSEDGDRVRAIAQAYGGTAEEWQPQGGGPRQWETITALNAVPVLIVNGQKVEPWYEAWGTGRTCLRRCDGEWNKQTQEPCLCNGPDRPADPKKLCKPTIRVQLMLAEAPGFGSWMLESHGENACQEIAPMGPFIAMARIAIPAVLRLRREQRREWNPEKRKFDTKDFFVPWLDTPKLTTAQIAAGGEELTQAMIAAGGSAMIGGSTRQAIEAAPVPVSAVPATAAPVETGPATAAQTTPAGIAPELWAKILADIEGCTTAGALLAVKAKLQSRGISDQAVKDAWRSKLNAIEATARAVLTDADGEPTAHNMAGGALDNNGEGMTPREVALAAGRIFFDDELPQYDEAIRRGALHRDIVEAGGPAHWLATEDQAEMYAVGDTVEVGGIEFTKIAELPNGEEFGRIGTEGDMFDEAHTDAAFARTLVDEPNSDGAVWVDVPVEGTVEDGTGPGSGLPMVPAGNYDVTEQWSLVMSRAGQPSSTGQPRPLTTDQVSAMVCAAFDLPHAGAATGEQLARIAEAMKLGTL